MGAGGLNKLSTIVIVIVSASAHASGIKGAFSDLTRLEAQGMCGDGSCIGNMDANGISDFKNLLQKVSYFKDKHRVIQKRTGKDIGFASVSLIVPNKKNLSNPNYKSNDPSGGPKTLVDSWGTGAIVSPCLVVTAYHVVAGGDKAPDPKDKAAVARFKREYTASVYAGPGEEDGIYEVKATPVEWDQKTDKMLLQLPPNQCIGLKPDVGWMTIDTEDQEQLTSLDVASVGVPGDLDNNYFWTDPSCKIYRSYNAGKHLLHDCITVGGDSGGPIVQLKKLPNGETYPVMKGMKISERRPDKGSPLDLSIDASKHVFPELNEKTEGYAGIAVNGANILDDWGYIIQDDIERHRTKNPVLVQLETRGVTPVSSSSSKPPAASKKRAQAAADI